MGNEMQELASRVALDVIDESGVSGAVVFLLRAQDGMIGLAMSAPGMHIDTMIGCLVQMLGELRKDVVQSNLATAPLEAPPPDTN